MIMSLYIFGDKFVYFWGKLFQMYIFKKKSFLLQNAVVFLLEVIKKKCSKKDAYIWDAKSVAYFRGRLYKTNQIFLREWRDDIRGAVCARQQCINGGSSQVNEEKKKQLYCHEHMHVHEMCPLHFNPLQKGTTHTGARVKLSAWRTI